MLGLGLLVGLLAVCLVGLLRSLDGLGLGIGNLNIVVLGRGVGDLNVRLHGRRFDGLDSLDSLDGLGLLVTHNGDTSQFCCWWE